MDIRTAVFLPAVLAALVACGGGGSGSNDSSKNAGGTNDADNTVLTGKFVDSPVAGLSYQTETLSGVTSETGEFNYRPGETVVFGLGDLKFPAVAAAHILTPLELAGTAELTDTAVVNMARLLQSLDQDCDPGNGITISGEALLAARGMSLDFRAPDFDTAVVNLVANGGQHDPECRVLIEGNDAIAHLRETLEALDASQVPPIGNGLAGKIGVWEGEGQQEGMSWTIKIILNEDKQTIEYPSLACGGDLTLISESDNQLLFKETITYGGCVNLGYVALTDQSENELAYHWYFPIAGEFTNVNDLEIGAIGTLRKTE